ncbi:MAG: hypothetical protein AAGJ82_13590, partial [Bacteroidota bacterium]
MPANINSVFFLVICFATVFLLACPPLDRHQAATRVVSSVELKQLYAEDLSEDGMRLSTGNDEIVLVGLRSLR